MRLFLPGVEDSAIRVQELACEELQSEDSEGIGIDFVGENQLALGENLWREIADITRNAVSLYFALSFEVVEKVELN